MKALQSNLFIIILTLIVATVFCVEIMNNDRTTDHSINFNDNDIDSSWIAPSLYSDVTTNGPERKMIIYGEDLVANTSLYFGPTGSVNKISNGMNCQNCHLDAGKKPWGNNYGAVASTYPKFRARSGTVEDVVKRINDCFERSLNGKALDTGSYEMKCMTAYINWVGKSVEKGRKPYGSGIEKLPYLDRPADVAKGRIVYMNDCQSCHAANGEGQADVTGRSFTFPPLWGPKSYNEGAGLYRLSNFAGFVKNNMPFNVASHKYPKLTNEEAWDVAAFVNSQPRPHKDLTKDWPDVSKKPVDYPFGPYIDSFSEGQHKFGPFGVIEQTKNSGTKKH